MEDDQSIMQQKAKAYQIGMIHGRLEIIKDDLVMGREQDALTKLSSLIAYIKTEIRPEFCEQPTTTLKEVL
jgi:hypothetical protein